MGAHFFDGAQRRSLLQLPLIYQKLIGMLNLNALGLQNCFRKIFGVESDDGVRVANNGGALDHLKIAH